MRLLSWMPCGFRWADVVQWRCAGAWLGQACLLWDPVQWLRARLACCPTEGDLDGGLSVYAGTVVMR